MKNLSHYHLLADLFDYPRQGFVERVIKVRDFLKVNYPEAARGVDHFLKGLPEENFNAIQELHTRSFDVQALTTLDVGYALFGDDYKRGELLSNLNREHREVGNDCGGELPDHLPNLLRLLSKLSQSENAKPELIKELINEILAPGLRKMVREFDPARVDKKRVFYETQFKTLIECQENRALVYGECLKALFQVLDEDFDLPDHSKEDELSDFLKSVGRETAIEDRPFNHSFNHS